MSGGRTAAGMPYLVRRLLFLPLVLFGVSLAVFFMMSLIPGDPAQAILGPYATPENLAKLRGELALDRALPVRYVSWVGGILRGDLGTSYSLNRPVLDEVFDRLGPTLLLAGTALALCTIFGLGAGVICAVRQNQWPDRVLGFLVILGISTPSFWLALLLVVVFAVHLQWFPAGGMLPVYGDMGLVPLLSHLALPAITLSLVAAAVLARLMRAGMLEVLRQDYVRTARAKGLSETRTIGVHACRNAITAMIPVIALQAGFVLGGAVYVETVFQWPGVGRMLVQAIQTRDILLVQGAVLVLASGYVLLNLAADTLQNLLDPKLRG